MKSQKKLGLALGAGGARGLAHIGVLKVLHKHKIIPDYLAGTSMGAVISAAYAAGHTPENLVEIAKTTEWKEIVDFTIPKSGLIKGKLMEKKIRDLLYNKDFKNLSIPVKIIAYNLTKHQKKVFSKGDVSDAVRTSMSIPGVFAPFKNGNSLYIDGSVTDPTPFDIVREMGADIVIAVDLYSDNKISTGPLFTKTDFLKDLKLKFIKEELLNVKNYLFPERWPKFFRRTLVWVFDKFLYPAKVVKMLAKRKPLMITRVMSETINILSSNLAKERLANANVDIKLKLKFGSLGWADFDSVDTLIKIGERAMEKEIYKLKKKLK